MRLRSTYWSAGDALRGALLAASTLDRVIQSKANSPSGAERVTNKCRTM
jgi:hypothetical protein